MEEIAEASTLAASKHIDLHVMTFAFTDEEIAAALVDAAVRHASLTIRILADWSQRIQVRGQQAGRLAAMGLPNLHVRYSKDQPYMWDTVAGHMRWSYHVSRGLLHHKTLGVLINGRPWRLICGSFNWTATAADSYENLLIVTADRPGSRQLMSRVELEFEALWSDGRTSLSPHEAHLHYRSILEEYSRDPTVSPAAVVGLTQGTGGLLQALDPECYPSKQENERIYFDHQSCSADASATISVAFGFGRARMARAQGGLAECNRTQHLFLSTPSGRMKRVPLTITNLALDTIFRAAPGDTLKIAMYGLSARVPEYGAILDAARRGVRLFVLLDRTVGFDIAARIRIAQRLEGLPIEVRTARRMMHQKYVVNMETSTVLTGTANMSTDATSRHVEHRIRISGCSKLAKQFTADFDIIWTRLSPNYPSPADVVTL